MREIFTVTAVLAGLTVNFIPFLLAFGALAPQRLAHTVRAAGRMPGRAFALGFVNFVFFSGLSFILFTLADQVSGLVKGLLLLPALALTVLLALLLSLGLSGMAQLVGERVAPHQSSWRRALWGTLLLGLGCALPFFGWFLLLPYAGWVGIGAVILGFFQRPEALPPAENL